MGSQLEAYRAIQEAREESREKTDKILQEHRKNQESYEDRLEFLKENAQIRKNKYAQYKEDVKYKMMYETLCMLYDKSIKNITENEKRIGHNLVSSYIEENGVDRLLNSFENKTTLLHNIHGIITEYYEKITEDATEENEDSQVIDPSTYDEFCKELNDTEDVDDVTTAIRIRVANAEEEFLTNNLSDKQDTEEIIKSTADRIAAIKQDSSTYENPEEDTEQMQEEAARLQKELIHSVREKRRRGIFEQMMTNLSTKSLRDPVLRESYCKMENGGIDMDKIAESVRCMYTMLEMVNTVQLETVDANYIEKTLNSI